MKVEDRVVTVRQKNLYTAEQVCQLAFTKKPNFEENVASFGIHWTDWLLHRPREVVIISHARTPTAPAEKE